MWSCKCCPAASCFVTETVSPRFEGAWNGIERLIPRGISYSAGFNYTLFLDRISVTDEQGTRSNGKQPGAALPEPRIWFRRRRCHPHLRAEIPCPERPEIFEDHDELYWNVTGDEWDVPIEQASVRILLPPQATGVRAQAFTGAYGAREQASDRDDPRFGIEMRMTRPSAFGKDSPPSSGGTGPRGRPHRGGADRMTLVSTGPLGIPLLRSS